MDSLNGNAKSSVGAFFGVFASIPAVVVALTLIVGCATNGSAGRNMHQSVQQTLTALTSITMAGKNTIDQCCATGILPADACARYQNIISLAWFAEQQLIAAVRAFDLDPNEQNATAMAKANANAIEAVKAAESAAGEME